MTLSKARRITDMDINVLEGGKRFVVAGYSVTVGEVLGEGRTLQEACDDIVRNHLDLMRLKVFERAGWKCERCGRCLPLQAHHKVYRSKQRRDSTDALEALCLDCHNREHEHKTK